LTATSARWCHGADTSTSNFRSSRWEIAHSVRAHSAVLDGEIV
jgi:hypothetical protein